MTNEMASELALEYLKILEKARTEIENVNTSQKGEFALSLSKVILK